MPVCLGGSAISLMALRHPKAFRGLTPILRVSDAHRQHTLGLLRMGNGFGRAKLQVSSPRLAKKCKSTLLRTLQLPQPLRVRQGFRANTPPTLTLGCWRASPGLGREGPMASLRCREIFHILRPAISGGSCKRRFRCPIRAERSGGAPAEALEAHGDGNLHPMRLQRDLQPALLGRLLSSSCGGNPASAAAPNCSHPVKPQQVQIQPSDSLALESAIEMVTLRISLESRPALAL